MATVQQIVDGLDGLTEVELDVLLEMIQLKKSLKKTSEVLRNMSHTHHMAHMPDSLMHKDNA